MSLLKLYNKLNKIKEDRLDSLQISTSATLNIIDNTIELEINGKPSNILITYSGSGNFISKMPIDIKVKVSKSIVLINNTFEKDISGVILQYSGNIKINSCQIMNYDGTKIRSTINNNQDESLLNKSQTNMEDDSLILYDIPEVKQERPFKTGLTKPELSINDFDKFGKIQKYGKKEQELLVQTILKKVPRINNDAIRNKELDKKDYKEPIKEKLTTEIKTNMQPIAAPTTVVEEKGKY